MKNTSGILFVGMFLLNACSSAGGISAPATATVPPQPTPTALPTPSSPGDPVIWRDLQVSMDQVEVTDQFITEFGTQRLPAAGKKFLWIHVRLENIGEGEIVLPASENFSVLYTESEIKPIYGHRQGYADYTDLASTLFPGQELDAWLRFDIPVAANWEELWFVFLPTSAQVGVSSSSPNYPYASNKPTYVWKCKP
ncbi:MAG: DUF4352 domain-containing protein [Anaerolineales bacterium]|nr:DUF4352 domain-containing protein [Anaerolineales bacterium]